MLTTVVICSFIPGTGIRMKQYYLARIGCVSVKNFSSAGAEAQISRKILMEKLNKTTRCLIELFRPLRLVISRHHIHYQCLAVAAPGFLAPGGKCHICHICRPLPWLQPPSFGALFLWRPGANAPSWPPVAPPLVISGQAAKKGSRFRKPQIYVKFNRRCATRRKHLTQYKRQAQSLGFHQQSVKTDNWLAFWENCSAVTIALPLQSKLEAKLYIFIYDFYHFYFRLVTKTVKRSSTQSPTDTQRHRSHNSASTKSYIRVTLEPEEKWHPTSVR
jgi:hypothetical protein